MDLYLAFVLIATPSGTPAPEYAFRAASAAVMQLAVDRELLDPRECRYVLTRPEDWQSDLDLIRRRVAELADAPPAGDTYRLPPREVLSEGCRFNRAFRKHLTDRMELEQDRQEVLTAAVAEVDAAYQTWDDARDARCEYYYTPVRRAALKRLRDRIGDDAYRRAEIPPCVPPHLMADLK